MSLIKINERRQSYLYTIDSSLNDGICKNTFSKMFQLILYPKLKLRQLARVVHLFYFHSPVLFCVCLCGRSWRVKSCILKSMHACTRTRQSETALSSAHKVSPQYQSHPMALHGWLHMLLLRGLPRFTAHNCLPLHRRHFSKYDSLILMCLRKHSPNTNAALHAWANHCRCRLIISPTCTLNWSVNSETISSSPLCPFTDRRRFDWWRLHRKRAPPLLVTYFHRSSLCATRKITLVQYLMEMLFSGGCLVSTLLLLCGEN